MKTIVPPIDRTRPALWKRPHAPHKRSGDRKGTGLRHLRRLVVEPLEGRTLLASGAQPLAIPLDGGTSQPNGLNPLQVEQAYGFDSITFPGATAPTGTGQTIAIIDAYYDPNIQADVAAFDANWGLAPVSLTVAFPDGIPQEVPPNTPGNNWIAEMSLDVEWAHALAPGALILLVETPGGQDRIDQGLIDGVNYARDQPGVSVVSMSWTMSGPPNVAGNFTSPNYNPAQGEYQGITFIAGSGDDGGQAGYPASSPNVLAVGGTQFAGTVDANGDYPPGGETAWVYSSGGVIPGVSPPQGQAAVYPNAGGRAAPDVAFDANTDVVIYDSYDFGTTTPWTQIGGTSIGAPAWSALIALADQGRALLAGQGLPPQDTGSLDGPSQTIPDLYAIAQAGNQSVAFNDVTSGQNEQGNAATAGYDLVTGLGTPKAAAIAAILSQDVAGPSLNAPQAGSVLTTTALPFEWSPVPGAVAYDLTLTDTATGKTAFTQGGLIGTSYAIPSTASLAAGLYTWDVTAVMADGQPAAAAPSVQSFTYIPIPAPTGPSGIVDSDAPKLQWSAVTGAAGYELTLKDVTTGATVENGLPVSSNSYTPASPLINLDTYEWTVAASISPTNQGLPSASPQSGSVYFTVSIDVPPVPISPPTRSVVTTSTATLEWSSVTGAVSYNVTLLNYLGNAVGAGQGITTTSWTTPTLSFSNSSDDQYFWYVQAQISINGSTSLGPPSSRSSFMLGQVAEPTIISPLTGTTVTTAYPMLAWSPVPGDTYGYDLSLFDLTAGISLIAYYQDSSGTSFTLGFPLTNGHSYEWAVSSGGGPLTSNISAEFTVSIPGGGTQSLAAPTPIGPSGVINSASPTFSWRPVTGATGYVLFYTQFGDGAPVWVADNVTETSATPDLSSAEDPGSLPGTTLDGTTFGWRVMAYDASGDVSPPSSLLDFSPSLTVAGQASAPTNLSPIGTVTTTTPTFQWSAVPGSTDNYFVSIVDETTGTFAGFLVTSQTSGTIAQNDFGSPLINEHQYRWYVFDAGYYPPGADGYIIPPGLVASQTFTLSVSASDLPEPSLPAAGTVVNTTTPQFQWSAVSGAVGYLLYFRDPTSLEQEDEFFFNDVSVTSNSYTSSALLLDQHTYQWQVCALFDSNGVTVVGPTSDPLEFSVSVPGTASLAAPIAGATVKTATPMLQWSQATGAAGYDLYLQDTTSGTPIFDALPVITTSYAIAAPLNNGDSYQWYVTAYDNYGDIGLAPAPLTFDVAVPPPPPPIVTGPIGQVKSPTTTFQVTSVPGATRYTLYLKDTTTGQLPLGTPAWQINGGSYTLPFPPVAGDTYEWYVSAYDAYDTLLYRSSTNSFVLSTATDLAGPPTPSPLGGPATATPTLQWSAVANAVGYEVEILDVTAGATGSTPSLTPVVGTSDTVSPPLAPGDDYQWQVEAYDQNGLVTPWSTSLTFHVVPSPPSLVAPSGTTQSTTPTFQWSAAAGAAGYQIEITDVTGGGTALVVAPTKVAGTSYTLAAPLTAGHMYQWQVAAYDNTGAAGAWSSPTTFSVSLPAPPPPPPLPPYVTGIAGVAHAKKKQVSAITIAFDEALRLASADAMGFYQVVRGVKKGKKIVYKKPVKIASVAYDGSRDVTVRLAKPVKGPIRLMVSPGIVAADGTSTAPGYSVTVN